MDAVKGLHVAGYLHRDIRPQNIGWKPPVDEKKKSQEENKSDFYQSIDESNEDDHDEKKQSVPQPRDDVGLYLLDVGFAVPLTEAHPWCGTVGYASPHVLKHLTNESTRAQPYVGSLRDDLHSLIRCIFALIHPLCRQELDNLSVEDFEDVQKFWDRMFSHGSWKQLIATLDKPDLDEKDLYGEIKQKLLAAI